MMIIQKHRCVGPLLPVKCGNMELEYTNKTKLLGVTVVNRLMWREHVDKLLKSFSSSRNTCVEENELSATQTPGRDIF